LSRRRRVGKKDRWRGGRRARERRGDGEEESKEERAALALSGAAWCQRARGRPPWTRRAGDRPPARVRPFSSRPATGKRGLEQRGSQLSPRVRRNEIALLPFSPALTLIEPAVSTRPLWPGGVVGDESGGAPARLRAASSSAPPFSRVRRCERRAPGQASRSLFRACQSLRGLQHALFHARPQSRSHSRARAHRP